MSSTGASTPNGALDATRLKVTLVEQPGTLPPSSSLVFGKTFTDHMLTCQWTEEGGWAAAEIKPYGPIAMDPASTVLHYAPTLFEGMKAYKDANGVPRLFRPNKVSFGGPNQAPNFHAGAWTSLHGSGELKEPLVSWTC